MTCVELILTSYQGFKFAAVHISGDNTKQPAVVCQHRPAPCTHPRRLPSAQRRLHPARLRGVDGGPSSEGRVLPTRHGRRGHV